MESKLADSLGYKKEDVLEAKSAGVFRWRDFEEVDGSSILFCRAGDEGLSQSVASKYFRFLKDFDFLARELVSGEGGYGNRGGSN